MCFSIQWTLGKHFLPPAGYGSIFPAKSCWDAWRSCSWLMRGQVNIVDEAKLYSLIYLNFEALVVRRVVGIIVENWALPVDQCCWQTLRFLVHLITLLSIHLRCNGFAGIQKAAVDQTGSRPRNSDRDFFWCKLGFGKHFGASSRSSHWAGHCWLLYKTHFSSQVTIRLRNGSLLLRRVREDNILKWQFFWFVVSS